MFLLKTKVVYSLHQYITKMQLNLTFYHLNLIIHVMSLEILSKLLFFVQSDIHQHPTFSISNNVSLNSCYFIMGLFPNCTSSVSKPIPFSYPPRYIYARLREFFRRYTSSSSSLSYIESFIKNENRFNTIRFELLDQQTIAEKQIQSRIDTAKITNKTEELNHTKHQQHLSKQEKWNKYLLVHYTHEQRLANNKKDFHQIWNNIFGNTTNTNTKLIIGTRNSRNATREMISKRPRVQPISSKPKPKTN